MRDLVIPLTANSIGYPDLVASKGLRYGQATLLNAFMLSSRGERRTTALGRIKDRLTPDGHRAKLSVSYIALSTPLPTWREFTTDVCGSRKSLTYEVISFNPILCIKYLIWFPKSSLMLQLSKHTLFYWIQKKYERSKIEILKNYFLRKPSIDCFIKQ